MYICIYIYTYLYVFIYIYIATPLWSATQTRDTYVVCVECQPAG